MKVDVLSKEGEEMVILFRGANNYIVNALRRAIISEIPALAVDEVRFYENSSPLWEEYIAHRLGLIPLRHGVVKGEPEITLHLDAHGPKTVYSGDLKGDLKPVDDKIPIVVLKEGEALRLDAIVKKGTAKDHAKYKVAHAYFRHVYKADIDDEKAVKEAGLDPKKIEEESNRPEGLDLSTVNRLKELEEAGEGVKVMKKEDSFLLYVESFGNMDVEEVVREALRTLKERVEVFG